MKKLYNYAALALLSVVLTACAAMGVPPPETFNQKVAVAYATTTAVRTTATALVEARKISADDAMNVQTSADAARAGIDVARKVHAADPGAGNARLNAVMEGLKALSTYLASRK